MAHVKLTDREFLEEYVTFAVWQPAIFSVWLTNQLSESGGFNKAAAIQIYLNFEIALEMLGMWYFALREWVPGQTSLAYTFAKIEISSRKEHRHNVDEALASMASLQAEQLLAELKQPDDGQLRQRGWSEEELRERQEVAANLAELLKRAFKNRVGSNADLVRAYNKLKHGIIVFQEIPGQEADGVALVHKVRSAGTDGVRIDPIWLPKSRERLKAISDITVTVCQLAGTLLAILPWFYFSQDAWQAYKASPSAIGNMIQISRRLEEMRAE